MSVEQAAASRPSGCACVGAMVSSPGKCHPECSLQRMLRFLLGGGPEFTLSTMAFGIPQKALLPLPNAPCWLAIVDEHLYSILSLR